MKAKTRIKLILAFMIIMAAALIGGCTIGKAGYDETLEEYNLTSLVTYYGNGGYFNSSTGILYRLVGSQEGSAFYNIQSSNTSQTVTRGSGWRFVGWYYIETVEIDGEQYFVCEDDTVAEDFTITVDDEEVVVVIEYDNQLVISLENYELLITRYADLASEVPLLKLTEEVDTNMKLTEGHIYIAAKWVVAQGINYQLVVADGGTGITYTYPSTDDDGNSVTATGEFLDGEVIYTDYFGTSSSLTVFESSPISTINSSYTLTDATWLEYYLDEECTQVASGSIAKPEDGGDVTVYVLFIGGDWTAVKNASGVRSMFSSTSKDYYVTTNIDCTGTTATAMTAFSGTIRGNGFTISNLTVRATNITTGNYAMFGTLRSDATITDITFDNLTLNYTTRAALNFDPDNPTYTYTPYIYMLFSGVNTGATPVISNVTISNSTMNLTVEDGVMVMNIQNTSDTDSWLYAITRDTDETDADYEAAYGGVTLDNVTLVYNEQQIAVKTAEQ